MLERKQVIIYTDGACFTNPGRGGYGVVLLYGSHRKELSGGFRLTTNNRMEILAAVMGLEALKTSCQVILYTDSQYLSESVMQGRVHRWRDKRWMRTTTKKAANHDLWARLLAACEPHEVKMEWVRGHAGNVENERCDELAVAASRLSELPADEGYEQMLAMLPPPSLFDSEEVEVDDAELPVRHS